MDPLTDPDRHYFIHTPECNDKWRAYLDCLKNSSWISIHMLDSCSDTFSATFLCFKKERRMKAEKNHRLSEKLRKEHLNKLVDRLVEATD